MIVLAWQPNVRVYEGRGTILRVMDDAGLIDAFKVGDEWLGLRLSKAVVEVWPAGATVAVSGAGLDVGSEARATLATIWKILEPRNVMVRRVLVQTLETINEDYEIVRARIGQGLLSSLVPGALVDDWSALIDAHSDRGPFKVETGIVSSAEIPARLDRSVSRIQVKGARGALQQPWGWDQTNLPACAFFADYNWDVRHPLREDGPVDELIDLWTSLERESEALAVGMYQQHFGNIDTDVRGAK
jgi:hypothetical protein